VLGEATFARATTNICQQIRDITALRIVYLNLTGYFLPKLSGYPAVVFVFTQKRSTRLHQVLLITVL